MNWLNADSFFYGAIRISGGLMCASLVLGLLRVVRGPSVPDRVIAADFISMGCIGMIVYYAILLDQSVYLDIGLVWALVTFLTTLAFARYLEVRSQQP